MTRNTGIPIGKWLTVAAVVAIAAVFSAVMIPVQFASAQTASARATVAQTASAHAISAQSSTPLFCNAPYIAFGDICRVTNPGTNAETILAFRCPPSSEPVTEFTSSLGGVTIIDKCETPATPDGDGIPTAVDNCPDRWNAGQEDTDLDGIGDACDMPDEVRIEPGNRSMGTPLSYDGCAGADVKATVEGLVLALEEVQPGRYERKLDQRAFPDGEYLVTVLAKCPDGTEDLVLFSAQISYLDPSGLIVNQFGQPLSGATVSLYFSAIEPSGPSDPDLVFVPPGSSIMSSVNRSNPVITGPTGFYKWDTVPGWYVVAATAPGCMNPDASGSEVRSAVLPVPPEQFNIDLVFDCTNVVRCNGRPVTINMQNGDLGTGTEGPDVILGTDGADEISGLGGNDVICALGGDDQIDGGLGVDRIFAHSGDDTIKGGGGSDRIWAGPGADEVEAGSGADRVWGGPGDDNLKGMGGQDFMWGEAGNDTMQGNWQSDRLRGGEGNDVIRGAQGKDKLYGEAGDDELYGGDNSDWLDGGPGTDFAHGQRGKENPFEQGVRGCVAETRAKC